MAYIVFRILTVVRLNKNLCYFSGIALCHIQLSMHAPPEPS